MKKISFIIISIIFMSVILCSCMTHKTTRTNMAEDHIFSKYEKVKVYDNESDSELGYIQVNDVYILIDEPFEMYEEKTETKKNGETETVKKWTKYEVLVQVNYEELQIDSSAKSKFYIEDCYGNVGKSSITVDYEIIPTNDKLTVVALKHKGDHLYFKYYYQRFHYEPTAKIRAEYNKSVHSEKPVNTPDEIAPGSPTQTPINKNTDHSKCRLIIFILGMHAVGFFIAFVVILSVNQNLRQKLKLR